MIYVYKAHVERVIDGDTADVTISLGFDMYLKERLRFYGIDCPETRTKDKVEKKRGLEAKQYVKKLIEGKDGTLETKKVGKFGRPLCIIFIDGLNLNEHLVKTGRAKPYFGGRR